MYEKTIQELAEREPDRVFPGLGLRVVGRQVVVEGGSADLLMEDRDGHLLVVELKRDRLQPAHVGQVLRYGEEIRRRHPDRQVDLLLAGPNVGVQTRAAAAEAGVLLYVLDMEELSRLADEHKVRDGAARPRRTGTVQRPSLPRGPGAKRLPNSQRARHQQELDKAFPPGSLTESSGTAAFGAYWAMASPTASRAMRDVAVLLSVEMLAAVDGSALSNRASAWTCFRRGDGLVIAALEPKRDVCNVSFMIPDDLAAQLYAEGLVSIHQVRNGGTWVSCRQVMRRVTPEEALAWYRQGLKVLES